MGGSLKAAFSALIAVLPQSNGQSLRYTFNFNWKTSITFNNYRKRPKAEIGNGFTILYHGVCTWMILPI
jgi:hypothetical protein